MPTRLASRLLLGVYALTTLVSALLLFEVQPVISKFILPWFGGSPTVWTTCMVFFQTLLFGGYLYAHLSVEYLSRRWQAVVHLLLLAASVCLLPIAPDLSWREGATVAPTWRILCLLTVSVGLPYFVLSATGPLVQAWFCRSFAGRSPYRLYALSNLGSLVALLGYPFFVEPRYTLSEQTWLWAVGFIVFVAFCGLAVICAARIRETTTTLGGDIASNEEASAPTWRQRLAWLGLPALASLMLLATTNRVCQDVAVIPFLWVAPLSLYLLSFIICFDHARWYNRSLYALATLISLGSLAAMDQLSLAGSEVSFGFTRELLLHFAALFCLCMLCHGELVRLRPAPRHLTSFYLTISAGGALGSMFVSLVAPHIFDTFAEWNLGLVGGCLLAAWVVVNRYEHSFLRERFAYIAPALLVLFTGLSSVPRYQAAPAQIASSRTFYGLISVHQRDVGTPERHSWNLFNGRIIHGLQFSDPAKRQEPTAYYGRRSGVGQVFAKLGERENLRVGAIGLGVGTIAAYARPGDSFRFYEINDEVLRFATEYFNYLGDCPGAYDVVLGDGRLSLEAERPQEFDLLVLDAFSGDAVPTHLLTLEAFEIYRRHLRSDAIVAINISNRHLDLSSVVEALADHFGLSVERVVSVADAENGAFAADWVILSPRGIVAANDSAAPPPARKTLWTDDHSNLFDILK